MERTTEHENRVICKFISHSPCAS